MGTMNINLKNDKLESQKTEMGMLKQLVQMVVRDPEGQSYRQLADTIVRSI